MIHACVDRLLPFELQEEGTDRALAEREGNAPPLDDALDALEMLAGSEYAKREALVLFTFKRWETGRTVYVHFLDGPAWARDKVFAILSSWLDVVNLKLVRTRDRARADVRISFEEEGSWSYLGTDALAIPDDEPTMNFGWLLDMPNNAEEWERTGLHEGGHFLGFGHEQAHPEGTIDWNRERVYSYYTGAPNFWSRRDVDLQVFRKYAGAPVTNFSAYDKTSIMHYPIPPEFVLDPADVVGFNSTRSTLDRKYAALWYPKPELEGAIARVLDDMARAAEQLLGGDNGR